MDTLSNILGVDEETVKKELPNVQISKTTIQYVKDNFENDYDKFKKFYKYCKNSIPSLPYQFSEAYKQFELNIVNNDIPFMSDEDEKEIMKMIHDYHNSVNDSLSTIKKMLIEINEKNVEVDTTGIVDAYDKETLLLQSIFSDIDKKLTYLTDNTCHEDNVNNTQIKDDKKAEKYQILYEISNFIVSNKKTIILFIVLFLIAFRLGGVFI